MPPQQRIHYRIKCYFILLVKLIVFYFDSFDKLYLVYENVVGIFILYPVFYKPVELQRIVVLVVFRFIKSNLDYVVFADILRDEIFFVEHFQQIRFTASSQPGDYFDHAVVLAGNKPIEKNISFHFHLLLQLKGE